uniref:uncharacterized protein LOC125908360 n=1 Tax=Anopheles coluzzii TaxID=1518534 RepID=UPI0020FFA3AA|nr:uncharacterized protein LOC125908360 [Anopheles coluzzii]
MRVTQIGQLTEQLIAKNDYQIGQSLRRNLQIVCNTSIEEQLSKFRELESCRATSTLCVEKSNCEKQFAATTTSDTDGRFIVQLPKREEKLALLGDSKGIATRRFLALERRLSSNASLKTDYTQFIEEYAELQHMTELAESDATSSSPLYYLPHHCIVRPDSTTTKLRVVFDASCALDTVTSLNDALMIRPTIQDDLISILLRFRMSKLALVADIEKMYRQINIAAIDRPLQRILWRNSPTEPIRTFQLNTVTYGTSCAPYLATKTLQVLSQGQRVCQQLIDLLASGGFCLRKRATYNRRIFEHLPQHLQDERTILNLDSKSPIIKTLGLKWNISTDAFVFNIPRWNADNVITKRNALSDVAKLFDPIGLVGPVIIQAMLFLQELWRCQIACFSSDGTARDTMGLFVSLAVPSLEKLPFNRLDRWQKVHEFVHRLWKRWSTDYLSGLQQRTKWTKQKDNVKLDTMVLLKEDGLPPSKWCLGRVTQIIKGAEDNIRVVIVKTKDGDFKLSISKICVLPTDESSSSS